MDIHLCQQESFYEYRTDHFIIHGWATLTDVTIASPDGSISISSDPTSATWMYEQINSNFVMGGTRCMETNEHKVKKNIYRLISQGDGLLERG